jgi:hypothetical protein
MQCLLLNIADFTREIVGFAKHGYPGATAAAPALYTNYHRHPPAAMFELLSAPRRYFRQFLTPRAVRCEAKRGDSIDSTFVAPLCIAYKWRLAIGDWLLAIGGWLLAIGDWRLAKKTGDWRLACFGLPYT